MKYPRQIILMAIGRTILVVTCKNDITLFIWKPMQLSSSMNSNFGQNKYIDNELKVIKSLVYDCISDLYHQSSIRLKLIYRLS